MKTIIGIKDRPAGYSFAGTDYDMLQIIHVCTGTLWITEEKKRAIHPGETLILFPHTDFTLSCKGVGYRGIFIIAPRECASLRSRSSIILQKEGILAATAAFMFDELMSPTSRTAVPAAAHLFATLIRSRFIDPRTSHTPSFWIAHAKEILTSSATEAVTLRDLFAHIPMSYEHFERLFRKSTGMRLKEYRDRARIDKAVMLLSGTDLSITDIAYECGYSSSQHFSTDFRKHRGVSPVQQRTGKR